MHPETSSTLRLSDYVRLASAEVARKLEKADIRYSGSHAFEVIRPRAEVYIDGSLVRLVVRRLKVRSDKGGPGRGTRGGVLTFSRSSRRRLMRLIAKTDRANRPIFVTLTYPGDFDDDYSRWKRDIDVFGKRFARRFGGASFVWRMEFKERKTGAKRGHIAPHLHLLVWGAGLSELREFCSTSWYETVGSGNEDHLRAGASCTYVRKWSGTISYVSKYIAKVDEMPSNWKGRVWGVVCRKNLPLSAVVLIDIDNRVAVRATRMARKMMGLGGKVLRYGVTFMMTGDRFLDYLEWAIEDG